MKEDITMQEPTIDLTNSEPVPSWAGAVDASAEAQAERDKEPEIIREYDDVIDVAMTDADVAVIARELAERHQQIDRVEAEKKREMADFKERLDELHAQASALAGQITRGKKPLATRVRDERILATGTFRTVRVDNGEVVQERALRGDERQGTLFDEKPVDASCFDGGAPDHTPAAESAEQPVPSATDITEPQELMDLADEGTDEKPKRKRGKRDAAS